jgi:serine phosphatase RsbU (regulator of sigma subunit)/anti-anti-sigma regulatory factor
MSDLRVLVVDDEDLILKVMKSFFLRRGDQCEAAANGVEALRLAKDRTFDLILSDISMPGINGLELIRQIKVLQPKAVCILMSGLGTRGDIIAALKIGVFDFIDKPIPDLAALTMVIDRAAESGRLVRERDALLDNLRQQNSKLEYSLLRLHEAFGQLQQQEEALASDLKKAQRVQRKFLPAGFPRLEGYDLFGYYAPCDQLGGDFFGTMPLSDGRLALYLVDVAGHGVSAAMITVTFRELMRARRRSSTDDKLFGEPAEVLQYMNEALLEENFDPPIFVSMVYAVIDPRSGEINVSCAGHPAPILVSGVNEVRGVRAGGTVLGTPSATAYTTTKCTLNPGDSLLFYSDGLPDARNSGEQEFSASRLLQFMGTQHTLTARSVAEKLEQRLQAHLDGMPPSDDITFLVVSRNTAAVNKQPPSTGKLIEDSVKIVMPERLSEMETGVRGQIRAGFTDKTCVVQLTGLMTWQMAAALREMLRQAKERATPPFHIDLSKCDGMDSTMLGLLLLQAGDVILHALGKRVTSQLQDMGVLHLFTVKDDPGPHPEVTMAITSSESQQACTDLILSAHEALMEASVNNREKFKDVVEELRHEKADT